MTTTFKIFLDAVAIILAASIAYHFRFGTFLLAPEYSPVVVIFIVFTYLSLSWTGYYRSGLFALNSNRSERLISGIFLSTTLITMYLYFTKTGAEFSRLWVAYLVLSSAVFDL